MKKKLPTAPVRANVRGTCAVQDDDDVGAASGLDRLRQRHRHHGLVVRVVVVGRDEAFRGRAFAAGDGYRGDLDVRPVAGAKVWIVGAAGERALAHERRARVLPRVPVEVKLQIRRRPAGDVPPRDRFGAGDRAGRRVQARGDGVAGVSRRQRRRHHAGHRRGRRRGAKLGVLSGGARPPSRSAGKRAGVAACAACYHCDQRGAHTVRPAPRAASASRRS